MNFEHLLDFDDMVVAPPVQDIWMLMNGTEAEQEAQRRTFFEGYKVFRRFGRFWEEFLQGIREQIGLLQELSWG